MQPLSRQKRQNSRGVPPSKAAISLEPQLLSCKSRSVILSLYNIYPSPSTIIFISPELNPFIPRPSRNLHLTPLPPAISSPPKPCLPLRVAGSSTRTSVLSILSPPIPRCCHDPIPLRARQRNHIYIDIPKHSSNHIRMPTIRQ